MGDYCLVSLWPAPLRLSRGEFWQVLLSSRLWGGFGVALGLLAIPAFAGMTGEAGITGEAGSTPTRVSEPTRVSGITGVGVLGDGMGAGHE